MSYHDPYTDHHRQDSFGQHRYSDSTTNFNPFLNSGGHNTYEDAANSSNNNEEDGRYPPRQREADLRSAQGLRVEPARRIGSGFEQGEFTPYPGKK